MSPVDAAYQSHAPERWIGAEFEIHITPSVR